MNKTEQKVYNYIKENKLISPHDTIIVGLSGGADSVCLLLLLASLREELNISIKSVHINHGIRGEAADGDELFARKLCKSLGIDFSSYKRDIPGLSEENHETEEECGRRVRYEIFASEAGTFKNAKIAVAHHMNDQAETVLFRMARGTGIKGIAGMKPMSGNIIRPLLCLDREEIESYLSERGQDYRTDATNDDTEYSRNFIRKNLIPDFTQVNKEAVSHICALSNEVRSMMSYIDKQVQTILTKAIVTSDEEENYKRLTVYDAQIIYNQDEYLRSYAIRSLMEQEGLSLKDIHREHIIAIENILPSTESAEIHLPRCVKVVVENGKLMILKGKEEQGIGNDFSGKITGSDKIILPDKSSIVCRMIEDWNTASIPQNPYTKWLDYDKIQDGLCVRYRQSEDYIIVNSSGNTKKLSDYMINEKIPKSRRDLVPVVASGSLVAWVVGHRISENVKITDNTKRVIEIEYIQSQD